MRSGLSREARAGMLALLLVLMAGYGVSAYTSAQHEKERGTPYHVIFNRVEGLVEGDPVYYDGALVGRVRSLTLRQSDYRCDVTISLLEPVRLTKASRYQVLGRLFGEKWVAISFEPGDAVNPGGEVYGESVPRFTHTMQHWLGALNYLLESTDSFRQQVGGGETSRRNLRKMMSEYNDLAFDMRVQANRFNQFSDVLEKKMDSSVAAVDQRIALMRSKADLMVSQMRLYSRAMSTTALKQNAGVHRMLTGLKGTSVQMRVSVDNTRVMVDNLKAYSAKLAKIKTKLEDMEELSSTVHLFTHNPRLSERMKKGLHDFRVKSAKMRQSVERMERGGKPAPSPSPSAVPSVNPLPRTEIVPSPTPPPLLQSPLPSASPRP